MRPRRTSVSQYTALNKRNEASAAETRRTRPMVEPGAPDLSLLSAKQKEALELVAFEHLSSKEIARRLSLSKYAVDARLERAAAVLGASSRDEAARIYVKFRTYDGVVCDVVRLDSASEADDNEGVGDESSVLEFRDSGIAFRQVRTAPFDRLQLAVLSLGAGGRLLLIVAMMVLIVVVVLIGTSIALTLDTLLSD